MVEKAPGKPNSGKSANASGGNGGSNKVFVRSSKFEGKCDDLKGHIFDCSDSKQADTFVTTKKEISEYVGREYTYGGDARLAVENMAKPAIPEPEDPPEGASRTQERIWEKKVDEYVKRSSYMDENVKKVFSLVWGQCTEALRAKLQGIDDFKAMWDSGDGLALLKAIKTICFRFESQKNIAHAIHDAKRRFYMLSQGKSTITQYLETFKNVVDVIDH